MSKRGAEKQLTDRDRDDDDDSSHSIGEGFNKAPDAALAGRKIRGLPQRKTGATPSPGPSLAGGAAIPPAFGASTGSPFGSSGVTGGFGSSPNPFAALAQPKASAASTTTPPQPAFGSGFSFGAKADAEATPKAAAAGNGFTFGATTASSTPSSAFTAPSFGSPAAKTNGSAAAATSPAPLSFTPSATAPTSAASPSTFSFGATAAKPAASSPSSSSSDAGLIYYLALRGINESLAAALAAQIKQDPFVDLSASLSKLKAKYDEHRAKAEADFKGAGGKPAAGMSQIPTTSPATPPAPVKIPEIVTTPPVTTAAAPAAAKAAIAPPAPPASFTFGGQAVKQPTASSTPAIGGFTPKIEPLKKGEEKSAFSFPVGSSVPNKSATDKAAAASSFVPPPSPKPAPMPTPAALAKMSNAPSAPSPLRFGRSASPPSVEEKKAAPAAGGFSFGASFGAIAKGDTPGKKQEEDKKAAAAATTSAFSFGSASATPTKPAAFSFAPSGSPPITTSFGASSPPSFGFGAVLDKKPATPTNNAAGFTFGSTLAGASTAPAPAFGGFGGAPKTSTGFSFGASAPATAPSGLSAAAPAFSFSPAASPAPSTAGGETTDGEAGAGATAAEDGAGSGNSTPGGNPFAAAGAGEEDEKVLHEARVKVWKLAKGEAEELGIARFMIKEKDGEDGQPIRRVLARHDVNGAVLINFRLHPAFKATVNKAFVEFVGFAGSEPCPYRVRIKTGEQAVELKEQLEQAAQA